MVAVSRPEKVWNVTTAADLERLPSNDYRYELLMGVLIEMAPAGYRHGLYTNRLAARITVFLEDHDLGDGFAVETGFVIEVDPDTVFAPDFAFIIKARLPDTMPRGFARMAPDLVLETRSPGDTLKELALKAMVWLQAGVQEVWALDPIARTLTLYRKGHLPRTLGPNDVLEDCDLLPGFRYELSKLFREAQHNA